MAGAMDLGPSVSKWVRDPQDFELLAVCHGIHGIHGTNRIFTYTFTIKFNQMLVNIYIYISKSTIHVGKYTSRSSHGSYG